MISEFPLIEDNYSTFQSQSQTFLKYIKNNSLSDMLSGFGRNEFVYDLLKVKQMQVKKKRCELFEDFSDELNPYENSQVLNIILNISSFCVLTAKFALGTDLMDFRYEVSKIQNKYLILMDQIHCQMEQENSGINTRDFIIKSAQHLKNNMSDGRSLIEQVKSYVAPKCISDYTIHTYLDLREHWRGKGDKNDKSNIPEKSVRKEEDLICV